MGVNSFQIICDIEEAEESRRDQDAGDFSQPDCKIIELQKASCEAWKLLYKYKLQMQLTHMLNFDQSAKPKPSVNI